MKIIINIVLTVAIILAVGILAIYLDKSTMQQLSIEAKELSENAYKLIPKNYGDDTIIVKSQNAQVMYDVDELFGDTTYYYIFISNNKAIAVMRGEKYRLQE